MPQERDVASSGASFLTTPAGPPRRLRCSLLSSSPHAQIAANPVHILLGATPASLSTPPYTSRFSFTSIASRISRSPSIAGWVTYKQQSQKHWVSGAPSARPAPNKRRNHWIPRLSRFLDEDTLSSPMAAPTVIPHSEKSLHYAPPPQQQEQPSPTRNSPPPFSPIYTRAAFSLPGRPISPTSSLRNTASGWSTAGAGVNSLRSLPAITSNQRIQCGMSCLIALASHTVGSHSPLLLRYRQDPAHTPLLDHFPDSDAGETFSLFGRHHRAFSTSTSSTLGFSSGLEFDGPQTTASSHPSTSVTNGTSLGRVPSLPVGSSYESIKNRRDSWGANYTMGAGWAGLSFRPSKSPPTGLFDVSAGEQQSANNQTGSVATGMGGLFRRLSLSNNQGSSGFASRSANLSSAAVNATSAAPVTDASTQAQAHAAVVASPTATETKIRGRQASLGTSNVKRKPSPHGERLLMGWTHAH